MSAAAAPGAAMPRLPGLDGLRGLAVIGAILFHAGFSWAQGGFLGVSTFFVLSGFLITNLLVHEWDRSGSIRLGRFWARRFRRLLPAALLALGMIALLWWRLGTPAQLANLRWDLLAALAYVANWRFYLAGTSYAELFSAPSPLQHFWSLAIEEQFYLLFPPAVIVLAGVGGRRLLALGITAATALSIGLSLSLGGSIDRIYYGTDTRAAELLIGALLALWWSRLPRQPTGQAAHRGRSPLFDNLCVAALAIMFWSWWAIGNNSPALRYGALPAYGLLTAFIIYAATLPSAMARLLSLAPLRWIGLISYGLYLYHWPVFLILDEQRLGLAATPLFAVRMLVTTAIAIASYRWLEMPVRRGELFRSDRSAGLAALAGTCLVALCAVLVTLNPPPSTIPYADVKLEDFPAASAPLTGASGSTPDPGGGAIAGTVMILGDSGTVDASPALRAAFEAAGAARVVENAFPGVGLSNPQLPWRDAYRKAIDEHRPSLVIMMLGGWDMAYLEKQGEDAYAHIVDEAAAILTARGARLLWLSMLPGGTTPDRTVNRVFEQLPARFPGKVAYADIETALRASTGATTAVTLKGAENWPRAYTDTNGETVLLRKPDFWHLCPTGAERLALAINRSAVELGWAEPARPGWQQGDWRSDPRYDDPPGGCVVN